MTAVKRSVKGTKKIVGRTKKDYVITACFYIILALVAAICLFPFLHVLSKSISDEAYVIANKVVLFPKGFSLDAYKKVFADSSIMRSLYVSVVVTVAFTAIGMESGSIFLTLTQVYSALSRCIFYFLPI